MKTFLHNVTMPGVDCRWVMGVLALLLCAASPLPAQQTITIQCNPLDGSHGNMTAYNNSTGDAYAAPDTSTSPQTKQVPFTASNGDNIICRANEKTGYSFLRWQDAGGNTLSTIPVYTFTVAGNALVEAVFGIEQKSLTIDDDGNALSVAVDGSAVFLPSTTLHNLGANVNIEATPQAGYAFDVWGGASDNPHPAVASPYDASTTIKMSNDYSIVAYFTPAYILTMQNASGPSSATRTVDLEDGTEHIAEPTARIIDSGITGNRYACSGWVAPAPGNGDIPTSGTASSYGPYTVTQDSTMDWTWEDQWRLRIDVVTGDEETGDFVGSTTPVPNTNHWYGDGDTVLLNATPTGEYTFLGWYDQSDNLVEANASYPVTMNSALHLTAKFGLGTGDIDQDGLLDSWEQQKGLKILAPDAPGVTYDEYFQNSAGGDPDNDGLSNIQEFSIAYSNSVSGSFITSNPLHYDTDGDAMDDGYERRGIDPEELGEIPESLAQSPFAGLDPGNVKKNGAAGNPDGDHKWSTTSGYAITNLVLVNLDEWRGPDLVDPLLYESVVAGAANGSGTFTNYTALTVVRMYDNPADTRDQSLGNDGDTDDDGFDDGFEFAWDTWQQANQTNQEIFVIGYRGESITNTIPVWDGVTNATRRFNPNATHADVNGEAGDTDMDVLYDYETGGVSGNWYSDLYEYRAWQDEFFSSTIADAPHSIVRDEFPTWRRCSQPFLIDVDQDGLPDGYEVIFGLDPWRAATRGSTEADGVRNPDSDWMAFEASDPINVHNQVYAANDFDPRTGYAQFYPSFNEMPELGTQASPNTKEYSNLDEARGPDGRLMIMPLGVSTNTEDATRHNAYDSDADGIWDGWEAYVGLDPNDAADVDANPDGNNDMLTNLQEFDSMLTSRTNREALVALPTWLNKIFPTDPNNPDTDGDQIFDSDERDADNGTFTSVTVRGDPPLGVIPPVFPEVTVTAGVWNATCYPSGGLSPTSCDTENDGIPDTWEFYFRASVHGTAYDIYNDPDGDGLQNYEEYRIACTYHWQWDFFSLGQPFYDPADFYVNTPKAWDWYTTCKEKAYTYIPAFGPGPYYWYSSGDPGNVDTDDDGMDDYYEVYHGLNPLYGRIDVVASRIFGVEVEVGIVYPALDVVTGDPRLLPAVTGSIWMDPDADGLINDDEGVGNSNTNYVDTVPTHHTDPSPYWITDYSYPNSWINLYYTPNMHVWYWLTPAEVGVEAEPPEYAFDTEWNEGFDTDNDNAADYDEVVTGATDPVNHESPIKRRALYLPEGLDAYARTKARHFHEDDTFRSFTVESWVRPISPASGTRQVILERPCRVPQGNPMNLSSGVRLNFRVGVDEDGIPFAAYNGAGRQLVYKEAKAPATLALASNEWTHLAATYQLPTSEAHGRLSLFVNGEMAAVEISDEIPSNGEFGAGDIAFELLSPIVVGAADKNPIGGMIGGISPPISPPAPDHFFKGWVDEVRIWDGARPQSEIVGDMHTRMKQDRVEAVTSSGALIYYAFSFDDLQDPDHDGIAPEGFDVTMSAIRPIDWSGINWWSGAPDRSMVYTDYQYIPWIQNTVVHTPVDPPVDLGDPSLYVTNTNGVVTATCFPNTGNPYGHYYLTGTSELNQEEKLASDMLPLRWAVADEDVEMWDKGGLGTDPYDSDLDGLPDCWEELYGLDPLSDEGVNGAYGDQEGDGMNNIAEYLAGTEPTRFLTGTNGYSDFYTWVQGSNSWRILGEIYTDFDGMDDVWESEHGLDPAAYDADKDLDDDGWSNYAEFQADRDPSSMLEYPVPEVSFYVKYEGNNTEGNLIILAYGEEEMDGLADAEFSGYELSFSVTNEPITVSGASVQGNLIHGNVVPGSLSIYQGIISILDNAKGGLTSGGMPVGTIDYFSGTYTLNFASPPTDPAWSADYRFVNLRYPKVYTFLLPVKGYLREGDNWFFAFIDNDDDTEWDMGEPAGVVHGQPYHIAWGSQPEMIIGLTDEMPGYGRFSWAPVGEGEEYEVTLYGSGPHIFTPPLIVRFPRNFLMEADYWRSGVDGLPADTYQWLVEDELGNSIGSGSFSIQSPSPLGTPTADRPDGAILRHSREEFRWTMNRGCTRFRLLVSQSSDMSNPVLDVTEYTPFREGDGTYRWYAPLYGITNPVVGGVTNDYYYWTVQGLSPDGSTSRSVPAGFWIKKGDQPLGPHSISGQLGYFGKVTNNATFVVGAYANSGAGVRPEALQLIEVTTNNVTADEWPLNEIPYNLKGLWPGTYYVWAHLDQNSSGDDGYLRRDPWETYGFTRVNAYYPQMRTVPQSIDNDKTPLTLTDVDQDKLADDWERQYEIAENWGEAILTMMGSGSVYSPWSDTLYTDTNGDGINDYDHYASGPLNSSPVDPDSSGADGIPYWAKVAFGLDPFEYYAFLVTTVGVDASGNTVVSWPAPAGNDIQTLANGTAEVRNNGVTLRYRLQYSENLITWTDLEGNASIAHDQAAGRFVLTDAANTGRVGFYRVIMNCTK